MANEVTTTTATKFIPEYWSNDILRVVKANLVVANLVKRFDSMVKNAGNKVNIPSITEITTTQKTAGSDVVPTANTEGEVELSIDQHYYAAVDIEDIAAKQAQANLRSEYTDAIGYAVAKKMDATLTALFSGFSQIASGSDAATALTQAIIVDAVKQLDEANAPQKDRSLVIDPQSKADILKIDNFTLLQNYGPVSGKSPLQNGMIGEIFGTPVYITTNVTTAGSPAIEALAMFHKNALCMGVQQDIRTQAEYELRGLSTLLVADAIWGVKELKDGHGVYIKR
jgi:hypothetical protein